MSGSSLDKFNFNSNINAKKLMTILEEKFDTSIPSKELSLFDYGRKAGYAEILREIKVYVASLYKDDKITMEIDDEVYVK